MISDPFDYKKCLHMSIIIAELILSPFNIYLNDGKKVLLSECL